MPKLIFSASLFSFLISFTDTTHSNVLKDPEASNTAHDTMSTMTAPEVGEVAAQNDVSTISASEVPDMETVRNPPGTINPSAEEAHINAGNLAVMKCYVSNDALFL